MQRASWFGVAVVLVALITLERGADAKGGGIIVPPVRIELGALFPVFGGEAVEPAAEVLIGAHWTAISWRPTKIDIGVGYIGSTRKLVPGYRGLAERTQQPRGSDDMFTMSGGYLSLGHTIVAQKHFRTWIEMRGELLKGTIDARAFSAIGGAVRFSAEVFGSGVGGHSDHNSIAIFAGTISFGVYLEASHRDIALELGPSGITGGFSFKLPFILAAVAGC